MFLRNYTSEMPVKKSINRIEEILIRCGVVGIKKEYVGTSGLVAAIQFEMLLPTGTPAVVRLVPKIDEAHSALWLDYVDGEKLTQDGSQLQWSRKRLKKANFKEQAERTAWKLLLDRVEVEMSLIELKQRDVIQAFMADVWDGQRTLYESLKTSGFRALLPEKSSAE